MAISVESVVSNVRERGLVPVKLQINPAPDDSRFWPFDGTLEEFLDVARAMGSKAIYFVPYTFEQDLFEFSLDDEGGDDDDEDADDDAGTDLLPPIDLVEIEPRLSVFRARIGEVYSVLLLALTSEAHLQLDLDAPWFDEYWKLRQPAVERLRASAEDRERALEAAEDKRLEAERSKLVAQLERLPTDPEFRDLRTKAAMNAYVTKHFPEARDLLGPGEFREKMTDLHNRAHLERPRR